MRYACRKNKTALAALKYRRIEEAGVLINIPNRPQGGKNARIINLIAYLSKKSFGKEYSVILLAGL
jgi:hypothetical protein